VLADEVIAAPYPPVPLPQAKTLAAGARACIEGVVAVPAGTFGAHLFYLVEEQGAEGLQVFGGKDALPEFALGDLVRACGLLSSSGGEKRLVLAGDNPVEKMGADKLLSIAYLSANQADDTQLGRLVKIEGNVAPPLEGRLFFLEEGGARLKVYASPDTGIEFSQLRAGERVAVTGILGRTSLGLRLLPRFSTDIHFLGTGNDGIIKDNKKETGAGKVAGTGQVGWANLLLLAVVALLLLDWVQLRLRRKKR
jgi:hypothetical protein